MSLHKHDSKTSLGPGAAVQVVEVECWPSRPCPRPGGRRRRIDTYISWAFLAGNPALWVLVDMFKGPSGRMLHHERPHLAARYRKKGVVWSSSNNSALSPRHKMARFRRGAL
jgi:hypothetical protein